MHLTKHHGLGNDFLVLADPRGLHSVGAALARAVCDRNRGVGADGLLHLGPGSDGADVRMVLLNADGGRAEMSGNGIGCLVQAAVLAGIASGPTVTVGTDAGLRTVDVRPAETTRTHLVTVGMGKVDVGDDEPEWVGGDILRAARADVGNPHLVLQAAEPGALADREWVADLGRRANEAVPTGINVEVISLDDNDDVIMDVFERGVGLTLACGTGACAAAAVAKRWELVGDQITVRMVGGSTSVDLSQPEARMTTPITYVAAVEYPHP